MGMMKAAIHDVVDVIPVGNGLMPAARTVDVTIFMRHVGNAFAPIGILSGYAEGVLVH